MNTVTDLAARAVSFIVLIQDTVVRSVVHEKVHKKATENEKAGEQLSVQTIFTNDFASIFDSCIDSDSAGFRKKAIELVWISVKPPEDKEAGTEEYTRQLCVAVAGWVVDNQQFFFKTFETIDGLPTPHVWRQVISEFLYKEDTDKGQKRVMLAKVLQYLPIQIVLALGGGILNAHQQRVLQCWQVDRIDLETLLTHNELSLAEEYEQEFNLHAEALLKDDKELIQKLQKEGAPLSFDLTFHQELYEIEKCRALRYREQCILSKSWKKNEPCVAETQRAEIKPPDFQKDPAEKAADMNLFALAFSGGGIRSATLNLGILQGLAQAGLLNRFDYLSTVSGGGYIGSWLAAWIKRDGSLMKVSNRLNPQKSPDPFGDEVLPIRWLRMFSNYLAPSASIMSTDAWTIGATWLRNTLLNQLIILLLFLSLLLGINLLFTFWKGEVLWPASTGTANVFLWSTLIIMPLAVLAGTGMQTYHQGRFPPAAFRKERVDQMTDWMIGILFAGAFLVSAWLLDIGTASTAYFDKIAELAPVAAVCFVALLLIAVYGRYDKCLPSYKNHQQRPVAAWAGIAYTTLLSVGITLFVLGAVWVFFEFINTGTPQFAGIITTFYSEVHSTIYDKTHPVIPKEHYLRYALLFIVGLPMVMEVFALTVVVRMALMGRSFPDERREWWGRIGAKLHRFVFLYILLSGASLVGRYVLYGAFSKDTLSAIGFTGGWAALVGVAVKAGFSAATSGKDKDKKSSWINWLANAGPYLFVLGLFIFLPGLLTPLQHGVITVLKKFDHFLNQALFSGAVLPEDENGDWLPIEAMLVLMSFMLVTAYRLARRIGVNEFSMHHFYRNRLVRAYLGATRRRNDRDRTANPFTGFDMQDDVKLRELQSEYGYYGPYPVLNTALNASQVSDLDRQDRKAESFIFSPLYCGFDFSMSRASADIKCKSYDYGFRSTEDFAYPNGPTLGTAMAISGAAANPNQGYHSSAATAFLLTVFNVQLGWWIGNPRKGMWQRADPTFGLAYIFYNLIGKTNTRKDFVCLSDGAHFDNMGLYEMVRRRCRFILLGDGEQDEEFTCEGLANAIRRCRIDFGAEININTDDITNRDEKHHSQRSYVVGSIAYADGSKGTLLYVKSSITGMESMDITEYATKNPGFPHQSTADQFFDEEQFESYRKLGISIAESALADKQVKKLLEVV